MDENNFPESVVDTAVFLRFVSDLGKYMQTWAAERGVRECRCFDNSGKVVVAPVHAPPKHVPHVYLEDGDPGVVLEVVNKPRADNPLATGKYKPFQLWNMSIEGLRDIAASIGMNRAHVQKATKYAIIKGISRDAKRYLEYEPKEENLDLKGKLESLSLDELRELAIERGFDAGEFSRMRYEPIISALLAKDAEDAVEASESAVEATEPEDGSQDSARAFLQAKTLQVLRKIAKESGYLPEDVDSSKKNEIIDVLLEDGYVAPDLSAPETKEELETEREVLFKMPLSELRIEAARRRIPADRLKNADVDTLVELITTYNIEEEDIDKLKKLLIEEYMMDEEQLVGKTQEELTQMIDVMSK